MAMVLPPSIAATLSGPPGSAQGAFPENIRGVPTAVIDPRGIKEAYLVNKLDQNIKTVRAADVSLSPESGLTNYAYESITLYDENDNVIETRIQNKDALDGANDFITNHYAFDILDQKKREILDVGGLNITNEYCYDPSQNLTNKVRGVGSPEQASEAWFYDERDILVSHTRGLGTPEKSDNHHGH